jgi:hypothetical protein
VQDLSASVIRIRHYRDQRQRHFSLGQIWEKMYGEEQCVGLANPTKSNKMGRAEETDGHHRQEWFLDGSGNTLLSRHGFPVAQIGGLLFSRLRASCDEPTSYTHVLSTVKRNRYVEMKEIVKCQQAVMIITPVLLPYRSCVGAASGALLLQVQRLIWDMRHFQLKPHLDCTVEVEIIIAMDGSVLFGVDYHSWPVATTDEDILMTAGGPDYGPQDHIDSYLSEMGGIAV